MTQQSSLPGLAGAEHPLHGLSADLDSVFETDRLEHLKREAIQRIATVAGLMLPEDQALRLPLLEQQWNDWSEGVIDPLSEADTINSWLSFPTTVSDSEGVVSSLRAELNLWGPNINALNEASEDVATAQSLFDKFADRSNTKIYNLSQRNEQAAVRVGYPNLELSVRRKWYSRRRAEKYVVPADLLQAASAHRHAVLGELAFTKIDLHLFGSKTPGGSETSVLSGVVIDPKSAELPDTDASAYHIYAKQHGGATWGALNLVSGLGDSVVEKIAKDRMPQAGIEKLLVDATEDGRHRFDKRLHVASTVLELILGSDKFKELAGL
ncbi:MAG TPA: hypothetical protein VIH90_05010 [Candidatus Saccharimonadales bacterium]